MISQLPLETLPGWPEAPEVSDAWMWLLMVIGPLLVTVVVTLLGFAPSLAKRDRSESKELTSSSVSES